MRHFKFKTVGYVTGLVSIPTDLYKSNDLNILSEYVKGRSHESQEHRRYFVPHFPYKKTSRLPNDIKTAVRLAPTLLGCEFMLQQLHEKKLSLPPLLRHYESVTSPLFLKTHFCNCVDR